MEFDLKVTQMLDELEDHAAAWMEKSAKGCQTDCAGMIIRMLQTLGTLKLRAEVLLHQAEEVT